MSARKIMICGATPTTRELLKRLGDNWEVTLLDRSAEELESARDLSPNVSLAAAADPSSPLAMREAGLAEQEYILALSNEDEVNLAAAKIAVEAGVRHVVAVYHDSRLGTEFAELPVASFLASAALARALFHFLEDPERTVTPLGLGKAAVVEMAAREMPELMGRKARHLRGEGWRVVGLMRQDELVLLDPRTRVEPGDTLLLLGRPDHMSGICGNLACSVSGLPSGWGRGLLIVLSPRAVPEHQAVLSEGLYWAQNLAFAGVTILCREDTCDIQPQLNTWPAALDVAVKTVSGSVMDAARELCQADDVGMVVTSRFEPSFLQSLAKSTLMHLAESLDRPVLYAGKTLPYKRILVPYNGGLRGESGLEAGAELARQLGAELSLAMVQEPEFLRGGDGAGWRKEVEAKARRLAHRHKVTPEELFLEGNPVREVAALSKEYDLLVVGGSSRGRGLMTPNVGENLAQKAECSVLVVPVPNGED